MNPRFDEEPLIRRYLLGRLSDLEKAAIEQRYFDDSQFFEQVEIVEDELIDDYLEGALTVEEKIDFEARYLSSPPRQQKIEFARALRETLSRPVGPGWWERIWKRISSKPAKLVFSGMAVGAVILLCIHFVTRERFEVAPEPVASQPLTPAKPADESVVEFTLTSRLTRSSGETRTLVVPLNVETVRLRLVAENVRVNTSYTITLYVAPDQEVGTQQMSRVERDEWVEVELPADWFAPNDYVLRLSAFANPVASYVFRVVRPGMR